MKIKFWTSLSFQIIMIFFVAMLASLIPEYFKIFGDYSCNLLTFHFGESYAGVHEHWGYRQWMCMGICLAIVQLVRILNMFV